MNSRRLAATTIAALALSSPPSPGSACTRYQPAEHLGTLQVSWLNEASGLAASRRYRDRLWTHNDSGDGPRLVAMSGQGTHLATVTLEGLDPVDWEDIAAGPCHRDNVCPLYVGDIGDNFMRRDDLAVFRFDEPEFEPGSEPLTLSATAQRLPFRYPASIGHVDAESLFTDSSGRLYLVTKELSQASLLRFPAQLGDSTMTLELVATTTGAVLVTAADLSPDDSRLALRSYISAFALPIRDINELPNAFEAVDGLRLPLQPEAQGEAITFAFESLDLITTSERAGAPILRYRCTSDAMEPPPDKDMAATSPPQMDPGPAQDTGRQATREEPSQASCACQQRARPLSAGSWKLALLLGLLSAAALSRSARRSLRGSPRDARALPR